MVDDPLRGTPPKRVVMHVASGDWQMSKLTAMVAARMMGVPIHQPLTDPGRGREDDPDWSLETLDDDSDTSALIVCDSGYDPIGSRRSRRAPAAILTAIPATTSMFTGRRRRSSSMAR